MTVRTKFFENDFRRAKINSQINFPCYKSLDEFVDFDQFRLLDGYLVERIRYHIKTRREDYFVNLHPLDEKSSYCPGVREIYRRI